MEMLRDEVRSTDNDDENEAECSCGNQQGPAPKRRRKKNPSVLLDEETARMLGEWLEEEAQFIYNKGMTEYKDKAKVFDEKAKTLNPPPYIRSGPMHLVSLPQKPVWASYGREEWAGLRQAAHRQGEVDPQQCPFSVAPHRPTEETQGVGSPSGCGVMRARISSNSLCCFP